MQTTDRGNLHVVKNDDAKAAADAQRAPIEGLMLSLGKLGVRILALTAPSRAQEVKSLSRALCASFAAADVKTALIDLDPEGIVDAADAGWNPAVKLTAAHTASTSEGYSVVTVRPDAQSRALFNNLQNLKRALAEDLAAYKVIVLNLAPVVEPSPSAPNPVAVARAADAVLVVCGTGRTDSGDAAQAVTALNEAGCKVIGTVLDDTDAGLPGVELADGIDKLGFVPAGLKKRITAALRESRLLNS
jgi:hypothetical protein